MLHLEIDAADELLLYEVIGERLEPPRYGTVMVAVLPLRGTWTTPYGTHPLLHSDVILILRSLQKWPHPVPPTGWMVLPCESYVGEPTARFYLVL